MLQPRPLLPPSGSWATAELRRPDSALKKSVGRLQSSHLLPEDAPPQQDMKDREKAFLFCGVTPGLGFSDPLHLPERPFSYLLT